MAQCDPSELGFIDKTSKDERTPGRHYGRSRTGTRAEKKQVFVRGRQTFTEALPTLDGIVAATVVEGSMTQELFLEWLENIVVSLAMNVDVPKKNFVSSQSVRPILVSCSSRLLCF
ncbi:hypothetical protein BDR07DRAFT_1353222 [Suillus spraguei]|jgi:hypothetical protein|nr:hypothetical protein BDR07DRAFT_1353219 [Suillus spraguei]KAG2365914.1 hypothetical protein BDR07DRAFT_1353222 [Suillus spraguei]